MLWLVFAILLTYFLYIFIVKSYSYWENQGVLHRKPWPLIGNMAQFVFGIKSVQHFFKNIYDQFPESRYMGMHVLTVPVLIVRDPDLIRQITIGDFDHFTDHALFRTIDEIDPILAKSLVILTGKKWKEVRSTIGPFFTSSKMKFMFTLISECAEKYIKHIEVTKFDIIDLDLKDIFTRFTSDIIGTVGFALDVDSLKERNNEFFKMGQKLINVEGIKAIKLMLYVTFPTIAKLLNIPVLEKKLVTYYTRLINDTIKCRESSEFVRPDMIHLFLEARKTVLMSNNIDKALLENLTNDCITAHSLMFFSAGFANTANALCFMSYELALNPDVQEKLRNEIDRTLQQYHEKITYEALSQMKYLDMTVSETLRKWPPGAALDRKCVKDYIIPPQLPGEKEVLVKKGSFLLLPLAAIQHDPKYFPNPMKFDPERFSDENKSKIQACSYLPMGIGPRYCIASRFAYMEIKIIFIHLLSKFEIVTTKKTNIPLVQNKLQLNLGVKGGFWLGLKKRSKAD